MTRASAVKGEPVTDRIKAAAAAEQLREMRKGVTLGGYEIKALIEEGRRSIEPPIRKNERT